jgi:CelD/BcsL family acetyltransferase involved in cellulose biosynthesis
MTSVELARAVRAPKALSSPIAVRRRRFAFDIADDPAAIEGLWRAFQDEAICSPYQRFDWFHAFAETLAQEQGFVVRVLVLRDEGGHPLMLLPLALRRARAVKLASFIGGKQANFNLPIAASGLSSILGRDELRRLLVEAGRPLGADAFAFLNQPLAWRGEPNALASLGGLPSANEGFKLSLEADAERTLGRTFRGETRKKMRKKLRLLSEIGEVKFRQARRPADVEEILEAFFRQKRRRFQELGIDNPFEGAMQSFIRRASLAGLDAGRPAIELYALSVGERIVATFGGTGDAWRLCGMFNSFDNSEDVTRCSPGELLLSHVIRRQCELGRQVFDLGVGEARYKTSLCDEVEELVDVFLPITTRGAIYAALVQHLVVVKRLVKRTPWALRAAAGLRAMKAILG